MLLILIKGLPECQNEEVLVEYSSNTHKLHLRDNALIIVSHNELEILPPQSFCIEKKYNTQGPVWITFSCRSKKVCDNIPCIRKCCPEGTQ